MRSMAYMDEWEYRLWLQLHIHELTGPPAVEQTASEEVGNGSVQQTQSGCSKIGPQER
ncbi:MAG: hypothetical protein IKQ67_03515 [Candidatus Methanomethylophilaceae archaeon]|nr:hypothetical protein [Candidatus Methanomethylophilaceae archaeon]